MKSDVDFLKEIEAYFVRQQDVLNAHFRRLVEMRATLTEMDRTWSSPAHRFDDRGDVVWKSPSSGGLDAELSLYDWSFKYDIRHCDELMYHLCLRAEAAIYRELGNRYHVRVLGATKLTDAYFQRKSWNGIEPNLTVVKDTFLFLFNDCGLEGRQLMDLRAYLRNRLFMKKMDTEGRSVVFRRLFGLSAWTLYLIQQDQKLLLGLVRLLHYHLCGTLELGALLTEEQVHSLQEKVHKTAHIEVPSSECERLTIDDEGTLRIDFLSEEHAKGFHDLLLGIVAEPSVNLDY